MGDACASQMESIEAAEIKMGVCARQRVRSTPFSIGRGARFECRVSSVRFFVIRHEQMP
jgi:hypothetical protein